MSTHDAQWWQAYRARKADARDAERAAKLAAMPPEERAALEAATAKPALRLPTMREVVKEDDESISVRQAIEDQVKELEALDLAALVERDGPGAVTSLSGHGLKYVELLASLRCSQHFIAAKLRLSRSQFKTLLDEKSGPERTNAVRLAWEWGEAYAENEHRKLLGRWENKSFVTTLHVSKSIFGRAEGPQSQINIETGPRWVLPGPYSPQEYMALMGQTAPREAVPLSNSQRFLTDQRKGGKDE